MSGKMIVRPQRRNTKLQRTFVLILICVAALLLWPLRCNDVRCGLLGPTPLPVLTTTTPKKLDREVVVASQKHEDTRWVGEFLHDWQSSIYVVDDPTAGLAVPANKGREAMVYLTYLIDRYDTLPDTTIFLHASRFQWHNDNPDYDSLLSLRNLSFAHIQSEGYVNLRCVWVLGCPVEIRPAADAFEAEASLLQDPTAPREVTTKAIFHRAFSELLPETPVPEAVGVACCSQFAVTRETIRRRPLGDYVRFREWLVQTDLDDGLSGRVFEYSWHIIFGKEAVHCPSAAECYCKLYGLCELNCTEGNCEGRYVLPKVSTLPKGWPRLGWNGEEREFESPLR